MIASRASLTQSGHRESVCRGQPRVGLVFSQDFNSGLSDHFGVNDGFGLRLLKNCMVLNVTLAVLQTAASIVRITCVPTRFGINLYPPLFLNASQKLLMRFVKPAQSLPCTTIAPGLTIPYHARCTCPITHWTGTV